jgi:hypothetical protein
VFEKPLLRGDFYTDTMDGRSNSINGNRYAQEFSNKHFFVITFPRATKAGAGDALRQFINEFGRPEQSTFDGSQEQCGRKTEFMANVRKYSVDFRITEPHRPNHNFAEGVIREIRKKWFRIMVRKNVPQRLWDYGLQWVCNIQNCTSNSSRGLNGRCPLEQITGKTVDISEYLDFGFYDWIWYRENAGLGESKLGRWLGVSHRIGTLMSSWVLTSSGKVLSRTTVQRVTQLETQIEENKTRMQDFTDQLTARIGGNDIVAQDDNGNVTLDIDDWDDPAFDPEFVQEFGRTISNPAIEEADQVFTPNTFDDTYLNMELTLQREGGEVQFGRIVKQMRDKDGLPIGTANDNPILDSRMYEVTYSSVVSDDSVQLAFLIAGLNNLDILAGDVTYSYLNASCREKIWFEGGIKTGEDRGKVLIVTRALYGLKSSGAAWRADLAATLRDMQFTSLQANPDVWIRSAATHYDMVLVYVDDIFYREGTKSDH